MVEAGAVVSGSVILDGARIGPGARVTDSVVGQSASVGGGCSITGSVVGDGAYLGTGVELITGARVFPDAGIPDGGIRFSSDRS